MIFLTAYVKANTIDRITLGTDEVETVRTINTGTTLQDVCAALVKVADIRVMDPKRR